MMDFGLVFYNKIEVQNAAQAGAQWAIANRVYNCSEISVAAENATTLPVTVSSCQFCGCSVSLTPPSACFTSFTVACPNW